MHLGKKGKPPRVKVGYKKMGVETMPVVSSLENLRTTGSKKVIIASGIGARKVGIIAREAEKLGMKIENKRKVERAGDVLKGIEKRREERKKAKEKKPEGKDGMKEKEKQKAEKSGEAKNPGEK